MITDVVGDLKKYIVFICINGVVMDLFVDKHLLSLDLYHAANWREGKINKPVVRISGADHLPSLS